MLNVEFRPFGKRALHFHSHPFRTQDLALNEFYAMEILMRVEITRISPDDSDNQSRVASGVL